MSKINAPRFPPTNFTRIKLRWEIYCFHVAWWKYDWLPNGEIITIVDDTVGLQSGAMKACHLCTAGESPIPSCYRPATKLREGNVFTGVCHSVGGGVMGVWARISLVPGPFLVTCPFRVVGYLWSHVLSRGVGRVSLVRCRGGRKGITVSPGYQFWSDLKDFCASLFYPWSLRLRLQSVTDVDRFKRYIQECARSCITPRLTNARQSVRHQGSVLCSTWQLIDISNPKTNPKMGSCRLKGKSIVYAAKKNAWLNPGHFKIKKKCCSKDKHNFETFRTSGVYLVFPGGESVRTLRGGPKPKVWFFLDPPFHEIKEILFHMGCAPEHVRCKSTTECFF